MKEQISNCRLYIVMISEIQLRAKSITTNAQLMLTQNFSLPKKHSFSVKHNR